MKQLNLSLATLAMLVAVSFSSCNKNQNAPICELEQGVLTAESVTTGTRVNGDKDNQWEGTEKIGIYCANANKTLTSNTEFTTTDKGQYAKFTTNPEVKIPVGTETYDVQAYYPYNSALSYNFTNGGEQPILYATAQVTNADPMARLKFKHLTGKIVVKIDFKNVAKAADLSITLKNVDTEMTLDQANGTLSSTAQGDLKLVRVPGTDDFYSFLYPVSGVKDRELVIVNNQKTYTATINHEIKAGFRKTWVITLTPAGVETVFNPSGEDNNGAETGAEIITMEDETSNGEAEAKEGGATNNGTVDPQKINITSTALVGSTITVPAAGGDITFNVTNIDAADDIVVTPAQTGWVTLATGATLRALTNKSFTLNFAENTGALRSSTIKVAIMSDQLQNTRREFTFTVEQNGKTEEKTPVIKPEKTSIVDVPATGDIQTVKVTIDNPLANTKLVAKSSDENWLTVENDASSFTYIAEENKDTSSREAIITLSDAEGKAAPVEIKVTQSGKEINLSVNPTSLSFEDTDTAAKTIAVTSNSDWTVSADSWLTLSATSGSNNGSFTVTATEYKDTNAPRTGKITVKAGDKTETITVTQNPAEKAGGSTNVATDLIISEYVEGSSMNKGIEIYNGTGKAVDLSDYKVIMENYGKTGSLSGEKEMQLSGTLEHGKTLVIANSSAAFSFDTSDNNVMNFNGNDGVFLYKGTTLLDAVGIRGAVSDSLMDKTLVRKSTVKSPNQTFTVSEWDELPKDTFDNLGSHKMD